MQSVVQSVEKQAFLHYWFIINWHHLFWKMLYMLSISPCYNYSSHLYAYDSLIYITDAVQASLWASNMNNELASLDCLKVLQIQYVQSRIKNSHKHGPLVLFPAAL